MEPFSLLVTLWQSGSCAGSAFLGGVLGNLVASGLWEGPVKDLGLRASKLLQPSNCFGNHDLVRALLRAQCEAMVAVCELTLREDYHVSHLLLGDLLPRDLWRLSVVSLHQPLDSLRALFYLARPEMRRVRRVRRAFHAAYRKVGQLNEAEIKRLVGGLPDHFSQLLPAERPDSAASPLDALRSEAASLFAAALEEKLTALAPGEAGTKLRRRFDEEWFDLFRAAFREELKGSSEEQTRARRAFELDILNRLDASLTWAQFDARFTHVDGRLGEILNSLRGLWAKMDRLAKEQRLGQRELRRRFQAIDAELNQQFARLRQQLTALREQVERVFATVVDVGDRLAAGQAEIIRQLEKQLDEQTQLTRQVTAVLQRLAPAASPTEQRALATVAQAEVAEERMISPTELQRLLAEENADVRRLLATIEANRAAAIVQVEEWTRLQRDALTKLGDTEYAAGHYAAAIEPYQQALALIDEKNEPLVWCDAAQNLELALWQQGQYAEAEPLARRVVEERTALQGAEHPDTLGSVNNLAILLGAKGDYAGAEPLYRRCLEAMERKLGKEHPDTLGSVNNLANLLGAKGDFAGAGPLYRRCLEARERTLGKEHPNTLNSVNNLANLLYAKGDYAGAEPLYRRCLEARERTLGKEHPDTLGSVNNLAALLKNKGDSAGAEPLYRRCLEAMERTLGKEHPDTLSSVNNLAILLGAKGDFAGAEPLYRRCLEARERTLGKEHPNTALTKFNFSLFQLRQGKLKEALELAEEVLAAARVSLPENHPDRRDYEQHLQKLRETMAANKPEP